MTRGIIRSDVLTNKIVVFLCVLIFLVANETDFYESFFLIL